MGQNNERLLNHYFRFVIREESGPLRDRLQRGLVERALKTGNQQHTMSVADIKANIEKMSTVREYPPELINLALVDLRNRKYVEHAGRSKAGADLYRLAQARFQMLDAALERVDDRETAFRSSVIAKIETDYGELKPSERQAIEQAFIDLVSTILSRIGEHCALGLVEQKRWAASSEYPRFQQDLEDAARGLPVEVQEVAREAFRQTLQAPAADE
jgi:hypothetical protein